MSMATDSGVARGRSLPSLASNLWPGAMMVIPFSPTSLRGIWEDFGHMGAVGGDDVAAHAAGGCAFDEGAAGGVANGESAAGHDRPDDGEDLAAAQIQQGVHGGRALIESSGHGLEFYFAVGLEPHGGAYAPEEDVDAGVFSRPDYCALAENQERLRRCARPTRTTQGKDILRGQGSEGETVE